jgi:hypothetical protein
MQKTLTVYVPSNQTLNKYFFTVFKTFFYTQYYKLIDLSVDLHIVILLSSSAIHRACADT